MQIILQLGSIVVPFAIGITINHANSMPFFSIVLAMADLHHRPRSTPQKTAKPLVSRPFVGSVWYYIARRWTRRQYSGLKDCRVLEYDTGQQVSGKHLL